jgi:uncharacterized ferritin-like protein (DUF455 family)
LEDKLIPPPSIRELKESEADREKDSWVGDGQEELHNLRTEGQGGQVPSIPARSIEIQMTDEKVKIPRLEHLNRPENVGLTLHHFANHELMAIELFAWAICKFPDAPPSMIRGFLASLREEQEHFRLYRVRMSHLGVKFGDRPLNRLFWRQIERMQTLERFTAVLSLSFEGANLDFTQIYSRAFRFHGDIETANIMDTVYRDEIKHVKRGYSYFKKLVPENGSEWETFQSLLEFPFTPRRAKGYKYFPDTRRKVGFSEEFIQKLGDFSDLQIGNVHQASLEKIGI